MLRLMLRRAASVSVCHYLLALEAYVFTGATQQFKIRMPFQTKINRASDFRFQVGNN